MLHTMHALCWIETDQQQFDRLAGFQVGKQESGRLLLFVCFFVCTICFVGTLKPGKGNNHNNNNNNNNNDNSQKIIIKKNYKKHQHKQMHIGLYVWIYIYIIIYINAGKAGAVGLVGNKDLFICTRIFSNLSAVSANEGVRHDPCCWACAYRCPTHLPRYSCPVQKTWVTV